MKATIIGVGNLGGAIACGLARGTFLSAKDITCVDPNPAALDKMRKTGLPFTLTGDLRKIVARTDIFILAVKPHMIADVVKEARDLFDYNRQIFCSMVAGVSFDELDRIMFEGDGDSAKKIEHVHFRVMPNIAISIGESMTFIASRNANAAQIKLAEAMFGEMGRTMVIPERLMPAGMAVASCGLAYAMRYVRAAMNGAIEVGFSAEDAHTIVLQTMKGAIELLSENGRHPEVEIDRVTSPGGYTIKGLNAMEEKGFSNAVVAGILASCKDTK